MGSGSHTMAQYMCSLHEDIKGQNNTFYTVSTVKNLLALHN